MTSNIKYRNENEISHNSNWIFTEKDGKVGAECSSCGYKYALTYEEDLLTAERTYDAPDKFCPNCNTFMYYSDATQAVNFVAEGNGYAVGKPLNELKPATLSIDCETIILNKRDLDISFKLESAKMENFDRIIINGITFVREKIDE
jgi:DNA-directed RNA polymerase subunit M/transcription elongation factor TFIIS